MGRLTKSDYRKAAQELHSRDGEIEVDDGAKVSMGDDDGAYVQAWVWVSTSDAQRVKRQEG